MNAISPYANGNQGEGLSPGVYFGWGVIRKIQGVLPGELAEEGSDAYQHVVDASKPEEEPVMATTKN
jgi:hypothetical protein